SGAVRGQSLLYYPAVGTAPYVSNGCSTVSLSSVAVGAKIALVKHLGPQNEGAGVYFLMYDDNGCASQLDLIEHAVQFGATQTLPEFNYAIVTQLSYCWSTSATACSGSPNPLWGI